MNSLRIRDVFDITNSGLWQYLPTYGASSNINVNINYILTHSGYKLISPLLEAFLDDNNKITGNNLQTISNIIIDECKPSWDKVYNALIQEYNPIENYNKYTDVTDIEGNRTDINNIGQKIDSNSYGSITINDVYGDKSTTENYGKIETGTLYGESVENTVYGAKETTVLNGQKTTDVTNKLAGFNSINGVVSDASNTIDASYTDKTNNNSYTDTTTAQAHTIQVDENAHTNNFTEDSYTDTHTTSERTDTFTNGSQINQNTKGEQTNTHNEHTHGNIGVMKTQDMINDEISLRISQKILPIIFNDIDKIITLSVY